MPNFYKYERFAPLARITNGEIVQKVFIFWAVKVYLDTYRCVCLSKPNSIMLCFFEMEGFFGRCWQTKNILYSLNYALDLIAGLVH
jgi:hypothetical protein